MTDSSALRETWKILEELRSAGDQFPVREVAEAEGVERPLCAIDQDWRRHLLIPAPPGAALTEDRGSAGVQVRSHPLVDRDRTRVFVDLVCLKPHLNELFSAVSSEVLEMYASSPSDPSRLCIRVLERWRELIEHELSPQLGLDRLIGLYGELWHLREVARRTPGAIHVWAGPLGARHDLVGPGVALEVKASRTRKGRFVEIHGHDQLEPPSGGVLYLASMKVEVVPREQGEDLNRIVEDLVGMAVDRRLLLERLMRLGVRPPDLTVEQTSLRVVENRIYAIDEGFPRITSVSFVGGSLPVGVLSLTYQLDLSSEPPVPVNQQATELLYVRLARTTRDRT